MFSIFVVEKYIDYLCHWDNCYIRTETSHGLVLVQFSLWHGGHVSGDPVCNIVSAGLILLVSLSVPEPILLPRPSRRGLRGGQGREGGGRQGQGHLGQGGQLQVRRLLPDRVLRTTWPCRNGANVWESQQKQEKLGYWHQTMLWLQIQSVKIFWNFQHQLAI